MAIHYDAKNKRFRDERGRIVSTARAVKSSIARREYEAAQRKRKPKPKTKPAPKPAKKAPLKVAPAKPKPKPASKPKPKPKAKPKKPDTRAPWERDGIIREYPEPDEWFPEVDFYGYDELADEWGGYDDEDTDS